MNREQLRSVTFRKASGSGDVGCVEVGIASSVVGVRDSKACGREPVLAFTPREWRGFLRNVRDGKFDLS